MINWLKQQSRLLEKSLHYLLNHHNTKDFLALSIKELHKMLFLSLTIQVSLILIYHRTVAYFLHLVIECHTDLYVQTTKLLKNLETSTFKCQIMTVTPGKCYLSDAKHSAHTLYFCEWAYGFRLMNFLFFLLSAFVKIPFRMESVFL